MRISVIVPCFNRREVVGRALESVLGQTRAVDELIVVDDCSNDGSQEIVRSYGRFGVRLLTGGQNRGANWARNRGIEASTADIICFLDSDDEFLPTKLARIDEYFGQHPETDLLLDSHIRREPGRDNPRINENIMDREAFRSAVFVGRLTKATPGISARREVLIGCGLFDERLKRRQDLDLLLRISRSHVCRSISDTLWVKHDLPGAISSNRVNFLAASIDIYERHPEFFEDEAYRCGVDRDLMRHFAELAAARQWRTLRRDIARVRSDVRFRTPPLGVWFWGIRIFIKRSVGRR